MLLEWARGGEDVLADLARALDALDLQVEAAETKKMLSGEHDLANAIITIHPGAGGVESQDWAEMLLRMYLKWAERRGFKREMLEYQPGEEAGLKSVTFTLSGEYAFGAGGQHVNVTDSAVRITHLPTGIVTSCQNERSQHKNKDVAMKVLKAKLYDLKQKEQKDKLSQIGGTKKDIAFGSQIRSYVLQPYQMIKDHRTKYQEGQVDKVLNGDLDAFIKTYLMQKATGTLGQAAADDDNDD